MSRIEKILAEKRDREKLATRDARQLVTLSARPSGITDPFDISRVRQVKLDPNLIQSHRVIAVGNRSGIESFKMLRTRVRRSMEASGLTTLAISSAGANEGKTLVAINLAFSMAADTSSQVILADFDLRNPSISRVLGLDPSLPGLTAFLEHDAPLQDICVCPGTERLAILPNTRPFELSSEVLSSPKMSELVAALRGPSGQRTVIFDMPPLLYADDFLAFSSHVDALLLVACEGKTKRQELSGALELLGDVNIIGTVLNKSVSQGEVYGYY